MGTQFFINEKAYQENYFIGNNLLLLFSLRAAKRLFNTGPAFYTGNAVG